MGKSYLKNYVRCPYYRSDDGRKCIQCNGFIHGTGIAQNFKNKDAFIQHMMIFCTNHHQNCEISHMLLNKNNETY